MGIQIVFETHSISEDNEHGIATDGVMERLSERGRSSRANSAHAGGHDGIAAVFTSDLGRAVETARIAFAQTPLPILADWRLRECDYGSLNGQPAHGRDVVSPEDENANGAFEVREGCRERERRGVDERTADPLLRIELEHEENEADTDRDDRQDESRRVGEATNESDLDDTTGVTHRRSPRSAARSPRAHPAWR